MSKQHIPSQDHPVPVTVISDPMGSPQVAENIKQKKEEKRVKRHIPVHGGRAYKYLQGLTNAMYQKFDTCKDILVFRRSYPRTYKALNTEWLEEFLELEDERLLKIECNEMMEREWVALNIGPMEGLLGPVKGADSLLEGWVPPLSDMEYLDPEAEF